MRQSAEVQFMKLMRDCQRKPGSRVLRLRDAAADPSLLPGARRYAKVCAAMEEVDGGPGSGNHNHAGRPGQIGGSSGKGGSGSLTSGMTQKNTETAAQFHKAVRFIEKKIDKKPAGAVVQCPYPNDPFRRKSVFVKEADGTWTQHTYAGKIPLGRVYGWTSYMVGTELVNHVQDSSDALAKDGGPGSGNFGHGGRPGEVGGSAPGNGGASTSWAKLGTGVQVRGPKETRKYIRDYVARHPEVRQEAKKYMHVRSMVQNFQKDHPDAQPGTYSATTGKPVEGLEGYCVTFHQNLTAGDPFGGYSDEDYAAMCAIAKRELGCDDVNIGYFGNAEVSFTCSDERKAKQFAVEHNQHSIYNSKTGRTMLNKHYYDPEANPIDL